MKMTLKKTTKYYKMESMTETTFLEEKKIFFYTK